MRALAHCCEWSVGAWTSGGWLGPRRARAAEADFMPAPRSFSAYILYDTQMICKKLSPDEWVLGVVSLYLDVVGRTVSRTGFHAALLTGHLHPRSTSSSTSSASCQTLSATKAVLPSSTESRAYTRLASHVVSTAPDSSQPSVAPLPTFRCIYCLPLQV